MTEETLEQFEISLNGFLDNFERELLDLSQESVHLKNSKIKAAQIDKDLQIIESMYHENNESKYGE